MHCAGREHHSVSLCVKIKDGQTRKQKGQWVLSMHGTGSPIAIYENL